MAWKDNLRPASFRGVAFHVEAHDAQGGRRTVTHEFPFRDKPYTEDMGLSAKKFSVDAYVVGDDYMQSRDAIMRACDEAGSGELVHPYLGTLKVVCTGWALRESNKEGRMARFSLSFVDSGEAEFPSDTADASALADAASDVAQQASIDDFSEGFSIDGLPDYTIDDAREILTNATEQLKDVAKTINSADAGAAGYISTVNKFVGSLTGLMRAPVLLATELHGLVGGLGDLFDSPRAALDGVFDLFSFGLNQNQIKTTTSTRKRQQNNRTAINSLVQQAAVTQAARIAPTASYETAEDAKAVRGTIAAQLDSMMEDPATSDEMFSALQGVRAAVIRGVPPKEDLPSLVEVTPNATVPALAIAYDLYEDAARESEIVTRNNIKHPGFVPGAVPLLVVSNA